MAWMQSFHRRLSKLEALAAIEGGLKKQCLPDWLQSSYEKAGFIFDAAGQLVSGPSLAEQANRRAGAID